jgi:hypothetical protein
LTDEPVPKLFPRFETAPFFNKTQKNGGKNTVFRAWNKAVRLAAPYILV